MGALLGRFDYDPTPTSSAQFEKAFQESRNYGPERSQTLIFDNLVVGVHSLSQDLNETSGGTMFNADNGDIVIADAILDNRDDLLAKIGKRDQAKSTTNAEIILDAIRLWGEGCVDHLDGDYAFAYIDQRGQTVQLFRDHIGTRPLYWSRRGHTILFGTSIHSLVAFDEFDWRIDESVVAEFLSYPFAPVSKPFFANVTHVPPGGYVKIDASRTRPHQWWPTSSALGNIEDSDVVDTCKTLLESAVRKRIQSHRPIGTHISGGLDSTGITLLASDLLKSEARALKQAFAWAPPKSDAFPVIAESDEREYIDALSKSDNLSITYGEADSHYLSALVNRPMEMEADADLADELPILSRAQDQEIGILLSGWGGDEVFSAHGFGYFGYLLVTGKFRQAREFAHHLHPSLRSKTALMDLFWGQFFHLMLPSALYHRFQSRKPYRRRTSFMSPQLKSKFAKLIKRRQRSIKFGLNPKENLRKHLTAGHISMRMESWAAWSAGFGVQYRYPLTDRKLLDYLFSLPSRLLYLNNRPRGLARAVLADWIPGATSKYDPANEAFRAAARYKFWQELSISVENGFYDDECPWIDGPRFKKLAAAPKDPSLNDNLIDFVELISATRAWAMYRRAKARGWV